MLSIAERHKYILEVLTKNGFVNVADICAELDVTPVTIRKDLRTMEEQRLLYRTHGGASPVNPHAFDMALTVKEKLHVNEKRRIAQAACKLLEDEDSIILGSGSTVHLFAESLKPKGRLTVITASLKTSLLLTPIDNVEVIQLAGIVRKNAYCVVGDFATQIFDMLTCSKLFLGVDGIDFEYGITNSNVEEAILNKKMMEAALRTIILADSSKFGRRGFGKICDIDKVDTIITDSGIAPATVQRIEELGIELIIV
ncbi:MAG: DeoR/GlpR family DNA-binding transcription regulator [Bacteroidales bacterium]|jgi:DeoR family transcriptional regulator of aga operon|nr:DeoR/GlpR family DNA-binding transcription regulator [Bacteroidales bacterium]